MESTETQGFAYENKSEFIEWMLEDEGLCKALAFTDKKFLDNPITQDQKDDLVMKRIFPYLFVPNITIDTASFVVAKFDYSATRENLMWKNRIMSVGCYCHTSIIECGYKYLRYDFIKERVFKILQNKRDNAWLGKLEFQGATERFMDEAGNYYGVYMGFKSVEFK